MPIRRRLLAGLLVLVGAVLAAPAGAAPPPQLFGGPFELTDHNGELRNDRSFGDRYLLVYFGYTTCPDICPTGLQTIAVALDRLGPQADRLQPLFISVDPARDRPAVLKDYVGLFHPRILGLTGTETQIRAVAKAYRVHRRKVVPAGSEQDEYLVDHSSLLLLMAPDGQFVTLFPHGTAPEFIADAVMKYLARGSS